ncbi:response regulator [uncultured Desulfosarcina sp.]|uniref:response regulator n=1 Tax=uncultured Desulfosarcina sp. TaxID=218289 RepID=UPI0029C66FDA|nr:response regulator [uncultured Desulfosarcina sp.]
MRVLIVDDDAIVIQSCQRVLEAEGMEIRTARSVEEGEQALNRGDFDLMLTDIKMPGKDGFEMIARARRIRPDLPILMMSGYSVAETIEKSSQSGANHCIAKPFTPEELLEAVQHTIQENPKRFAIDGGTGK